MFCLCTPQDGIEGRCTDVVAFVHDHLPVPLGYDVVERKLVVNEKEAALVRRIFDDFVNVGSTTTMAKTYAAEGLLSKVGKPLNNPEMWIKKEGAFEGIVPPELFYTAQGILRERAQAQGVQVAR